MEGKIKIKEYFEKGTRFEVPTYQRGYKWGVKSANGTCSVNYFSDSLIGAFQRGDHEYFIEAVTVVQEKDGDPIILVDGQQRTTTLILLFVALEDYAFLSGINLDYTIRPDSHAYLNHLIHRNDGGLIDGDIQDIFYFNEALKTIRKKLAGFKLNGNLMDIKTSKVIIKEPMIDINNGRIDIQEKEKTFLEFLKDNVCLLFNQITADKAVSTFISLNGLKAIMKDEELIKSDLLIKSSSLDLDNGSLDSESTLGIEWKVNEDRSRLARNWDKWLYWWNQEDVKNYYNTSSHHPLYFLLVTYWELNKKTNKGSFDFDHFFNHFKTEFINNSEDARYHFEGLRKLQKKFEDLYTHYHSYNFLGLILKTSSSKEKVLQHILGNKISDNELEEYAKWSLISATHSQIIINNTEAIAQKKSLANDRIGLIAKKYVYWDEFDQDFNDNRKRYANEFLLLLNLLEDNKLKRRFDFSIWENRSLEHIYPKSKKQMLDFNQQGMENGSIHCIGNLVLLYGSNNSEFGNKDVAEKKLLYFNTHNKVIFLSRNLLHSLSVFACADWGTKEIIENKNKTIQILQTYYGIN
jgi:hypothetical protein